MRGLKATSRQARRFYNDLVWAAAGVKKSSVFWIWKRETEVSLSMIDNNIIL